MENKHWSDEELMALLYGVGYSAERDRDGHLERCGKCTEKWNALRERRDALTQPVSVSEQVMAGQKRAIMRRVLESRERRVWLGFPWQRAFAGAVLASFMLIAIVLHNSANGPQVPVDNTSAAADAKLFTEVMYEAARTEPAAFTPVEGLFEKQVRAVRR